MEDNYFDKKLKSILESAPNMEPSEGAIGDMRSRLRAQAAPKRRPLTWWYLAAAAVLLPFLLLAGFGIQKYNSLQDEMIALRKEVSTFQSITQTDTIIEKQVIHHYDTIYSTIIREALVLTSEGSSGSSLIKQRSAEQQRFARGLQSSMQRLTALTITTPDIKELGSDGGIYSLLTNRRSPRSFNERIGLGTVFPAEPYDVWQTEVEPLGFVFPRMLLSPERSTPEWIDELKTKANNRARNINPMYFFVPEGFVLEAGFTPAIIPFNNAKGSSKEAFGVAGAITFAGGRSLRIGVEWLRENFEIKDDDILNFPEFPIVNPSDPVDVLHELKGNFSTLQIPITLRQGIGIFGRWRPFIEAGIVATRPLSQDFIYEYINTGGEYKLTNSFNDGVFSAENMRLGVGTDFEISDRWSATSFVTYQRDFEQGVGEFEKAEQLQFQVGLSYRLQP